MEKFAFIIHPIDLQDVEKFEKGARGRSPQLVMKILEWTPPFKISHITGIKSKTGAEAEGWFVACPLLPKQFLELDEDFVVGKIVKAGQIAQELGAKVVGLGAFTSIVKDSGISIANHLEIAVTTGNSYTIYTAVKGAEIGAQKMGFSLKEAKAAVVVGATGSIGRVCAQILAKDVPSLILVGRSEEKLKQVQHLVKEQAPAEVSVSTDTSWALSKADVIITVTSSLDTVINPLDIKPGAVVCDAARPRDVSYEVAEVRQDVLVIDGGVVKVPGEPEFNYDFGFPKGYAFACMSETMILALEKKYANFSLGKELELSRVLEIGQLAEKHGFSLAGLRSFDRALTDDQIEEIKKKAKQKLSKKTQEQSSRKSVSKPIPGTSHSY